MILFEQLPIPLSRLKNYVDLFPRKSQSSHKKSIIDTLTN